MKRTMKKILPILLSLVVICSIIWYLFVYDRGFMQDILLGSARFFEQQGNHSISTWLYNQAYLHSGNSDSVIIELAERFKKMGNYTQAEVVLTRAIADNGSVDLYIAVVSNPAGVLNQADVGGVYQGEWIQGVDRWITTVYQPLPYKLPRTGY